MKFHFYHYCSTWTLALIFSLGNVSANDITNSTMVMTTTVLPSSIGSGLRGGTTKHTTTTTKRILQVNSGEITGAFDVVALVRFNDIAGGWFQRVFDFGNGEGNDNVWLGQENNSNDMAFEIVVGTKYSRCVARGAIVQGELATWKAGVDSNGVQWIEKNGHRIASIQGQVPSNIFRAQLLGQSNWAADTQMKGAVIGIDITNAGENRDGGLLNKPAQIGGPFIISVQARFDAPQGGWWQRVFDFGNGPGRDNIIMGQLENTNDMLFEIWQADKTYRLVAPGAITTGQLATWRVGIDVNGQMWMEKDGKRVAQMQGVVPAAVQRNSNLLGSSNWDNSASANLDEVVLGLSVSTAGSLLVPAPVPVPVPAPCASACSSSRTIASACSNSTRISSVRHRR